MKHAIIVVLVFMCIVAGSTCDVCYGAKAAWQDKVATSVLGPASADSREFFITLHEQADLSGASRFESKSDRNGFVFEALRATALRTQPVILAELRSLGVEAQSFWIVNAILVDADEFVLERMACRDDVAMIYGNPDGGSPGLLDPAEITPVDKQDRDVAGNIEVIHAPDVWEHGVTGEGVVVASIDLGVEWSHPALINQYRGWDGVTADHDYNWFDVTGDYPAEPHDNHGHGTGVMGTVLGDDGGDNQIGVAPGARWIAYRVSDNATWLLSWYLEAMQWVIAPTDRSGENPDPGQAPDIVYHGWVCWPSEGCTDPLIIEEASENLSEAGIVQIIPAGNSGPNCSTIVYPPAIYESNITVGATFHNDFIVSFSGRGPVTSDGSDRLKPDLVAPSPVWTAWLNGSYASVHATSFSSPHVAGVIALLISADSQLAGDVDQLQWLVEQSAIQLTTTQECGGVPGSEVPNNTYGWGRVDALAAYELAVNPTWVDASRLPRKTTVAQNIPNPFNPATMIRYELSAPGHASVVVYNLAGHRVRILTAMHHEAGLYEVRWDGKDDRGQAVTTGPYFYRLETGGRAIGGKMLLLR